MLLASGLEVGAALMARAERKVDVRTFEKCILAQAWMVQTWLRKIAIRMNGCRKIELDLGGERVRKVCCSGALRIED